MVNHSCPFENCSSTFNRPYRLRIHIQRHQGIKEFQCTQCDRSYHRRQHLQRHIAEAHQNQSRLEIPLSCDHCERQFNTAWGLRRHQIRIKRIRQHCCEICGNSFYTQKDLELHYFIHQRFNCVIPSCPLSNHQFNWKNYNHHMVVYHSDPFECEHCGERFLLKNQIRLHVVQHMPKFPCTQPGCNKMFTFHKNMVRHIQFGHGERTLKCNIMGCDSKFKYKYCYDRHLKVHQQNKKIVPMAKRLNKKEPKFIMANKLAALALKT